MAKKQEQPEEQHDHFIEMVQWLGGNMDKATQLESEYQVAFAKEGVPDGAVKRYLDEVFAPGVVQQRLMEMIKERFYPAVKEQ